MDPMSSTIFGPVFRMGAFAHPSRTLDSGRGRGPGHRRPGPRPKKVLPRRAGCDVQLGGPTIVERLMRSLVVVERHVLRNPTSRITRVLVVGQIHLLVLQTAPEALGEDSVGRAPLAVHADLNPSIDERLRDERTREMTTLVGIPDHRLAGHACLSDGVEHERQFQGVVERPTDDVATEPVEDGHQVQPAVP